jgi:hypothetical protein
MIFSVEPPNVIPEGLAWLLAPTLHILGVAREKVGSLEVAGEYVLWIFLAINRASRKMVKPGPSHDG